MEEDLETSIRKTLLDPQAIHLTQEALRKIGKSFYLAEGGESLRYSPLIDFDLKEIEKGERTLETYAPHVSLALFKGLREFEETYGELPRKERNVFLCTWNPEYSQAARIKIQDLLRQKGDGELALNYPDLRRSPRKADFLALEMLRQRYPHITLVMGWKTSEQGDSLSLKIVKPKTKIENAMLEQIAQAYLYSHAASPHAEKLRAIFQGYYDLHRGIYDLRERILFFM